MITTQTDNISRRLGLSGNQHYYVWSAAFAILMVVWLWPTLQVLHQRWVGAAIEYGYAPVIMAVVLIALEARGGGPLVGRPSLIGLSALTLAVAMVTLSRAAEIVIIPQLLLPPIVAFGIWSIAGWQTALRFSLPLIFLYFVIPFWQVAGYLGLEEPWLAGILRDITVAVVSLAIGLTGIPAFVQGDLISLPTGTMEVAEGCSGRSYFIVALELSLFYGIAFLRRWRLRLTLVVAAAAMAMVGNWIRVFLLVLVGYYTDMTHPLVMDHEFFGWVIFLFVIASLMLVVRVLESLDWVPLTAQAEDTMPIRRRRWVFPLSGVAVLLVGVLCNLKINSLYAEVADKIVLDAPFVSQAEELSAWRDDTRPVFPSAPSEVGALYQFERGIVGLYIAHYPVQRQRSEVVHFSNRPEGSLGTVSDEGSVVVGAGENGSFRFRRLLVEQDGAERAILFGMRIGGASTADATTAKLLQLRAIALGRTDAEVLVFSQSCETSCKIEWDILTQFASLALPEIIADLDANVGHDAK